MTNSTALATIDASELETMQRTAKMMMASGFFGGRGEEGIAQIAVKIMAGREMGYGPFASVRGIHVIQGTPALSANLMAAAVKGSGRYDYRIRTMTDTECAIEFFENMGGQRDSLGMSTFTIADARKAQTKNLDKFARNMLFARAMSNGVRWYCPDVFSGNAVYVPEELGADVDGETGEILQGNYKVVQPEPVKVEATPVPVFVSPETANALQHAVERKQAAAPVQMADIYPPADPADDSAWGNEAEADNPFTARPEWTSPMQAQQWAVDVGACANSHEARQSWVKVVGGKSVGPDALPGIYDAYYARQMEKLNAA